MSRKLTVVLLAMLVLVGAMSLKTVVVTHGDGGPTHSVFLSLRLPSERPPTIPCKWSASCSFWGS